jgi:hypothetical protein
MTRTRQKQLIRIAQGRVKTLRGSFYRKRMDRVEKYARDERGGGDAQREPEFVSD